MEKLCEKCGKKVYAKGLCQSCYVKSREKYRKTKICSNCGREVLMAANGLCHRCYNIEWKKNKKLNKEPPAKSAKITYDLKGDDADVLRSLSKEYRAASINIMAKTILNAILYEMSDLEFKALMKKYKENRDA